jgi:hypothetical protein
MMNRNLTHACGAILIFSGVFMVAACREQNDEVASQTSVSDAQPAATPTGPPNYGGAVDNITCRAISGWVWNSFNIADELKVDIYADGKLTGTVPAVNPRLDLKPMGGTGNYGFLLPVPASLKDGQPHKISAKVAGAAFDITVWEKVSPVIACQRKYSGSRYL